MSWESCVRRFEAVDAKQLDPTSDFIANMTIASDEWVAELLELGGVARLKEEGFDRTAEWVTRKLAELGGAA